MKKYTYLFQTLFFIAIGVILFQVLRIAPSVPAKAKKTLNVYVWGDFFNVSLIKEFERKTGAKVFLNYYLSNEELLAKIRASNGRCADIIFPSDYAVKTLIKEGYLEKIEHERLNFFHKLDSMVLDKPFDRMNKYSLPYTWEIYGVIADKDNPLVRNICTLKEIMTKRSLEKITMPNDPIEMFCIASQSLFGNLQPKNREEIGHIAKAISAQRSRVHAYVDYQAKFIFAGKCSDIGFTRSSYYCLLADENNKHHLKFTPTTDGLFMSIENTAILKSSKNKDLIYTFINDIYKESNMAIHIQECPMFPAIESLASSMEFSPEYLDIYQKAKENTKLCFFDYYIDEKTIRKEWVKIKAT